MLDKRNKKLAGVCAGFARYMEVDVILVRMVWLVVAVATGVGFLAYLAAWIIMPSDYGSRAPQTAFVPGPLRAGLTPHLISRIMTEWSDTFCSRSVCE